MIGELDKVVFLYMAKHRIHINFKTNKLGRNGL